jgi:hypothetical protein
MAGELVRFPGGRNAYRDLARDRGEQGRIDLAPRGYQADDRDEIAGALGHEDERLHDLAEIGVDGRGYLPCIARRAGDQPDLELDTLAGCYVHDFSNCRMREIAHVGGQSSS